MANLGVISYIDCALTNYLLRPYPDASEKAAAFISFLSFASRQGHLCIHIHNSSVSPPLHLLLESQAELKKNLSNEISHYMRCISEGALLLPEDLVTTVEDATTSPITPICRSIPAGRGPGCDFYLQRSWVDESLFIRHFECLQATAPALSIDFAKVKQQVDELTAAQSLLPEQAEAILCASQQPLTLITGGPGTGKTYTAGMLIKVFWKSLTPEQQKNCIIKLAAPTGKAAGNLQQSLNKAVGELDSFKPLTAQTLHSLLGMKGRAKKTSASALHAHLMIIDESSMIDVGLMGRLVSSVPIGCRLILLGDRHQLSPVEAGSVFSDIIQRAKAQNLPCCELRTCLRAELQPLIDLAQAVNTGNSSLTLSLLNKEGVGIKRLSFFHEEQTASQQQKELVHYVLNCLPNQQQNPEETPEKLLEQLSQYCVLTPLRKGLFGVEELNRLLLKERLQRMPSSGYFCAPILITKNCPQQGLFNGDMGLLVRKIGAKFNSKQSKNHFQEGDYALFARKEQGLEKTGSQRIPAVLLPSFEYAYCLTIHKSQGSEFSRVLLLMPEGAEIFGRQAFYTGITRARQKLEVWGSDATLQQAISTEKARISGITRRLSFS